MDLISPDSDKHISPEQLYQKLHAANHEHAATRRELSEQKLRVGNLQSELSEVAALLQEREGQIHYYERVLTEEGLPAVLMPNHHNNSHSGSARKSTSRPHRLLREEQEQLQMTATATIGSLRALLEEKNVIIDKLHTTIDRLTIHSNAHVRHGSGRTRAEIRADDLLDKLNNESNEESRARRYGVVLHPEVFSAGIGGATEGERAHLKHLLDQLETADGIIAEKDATVMALEQKLLYESNARERAELRYCYQMPERTLLI